MRRTPVPKLLRALLCSFAFVLGLTSIRAQTGNYNFVNIAYPGAAGPTYANSINDSGAIVGYYADSGGFVHGYIYQNGQYAEFDVTGATATECYGINNLGDISGIYSDSSGDEHGFLYVHATGHFTVIDYPGAQSTKLYQLNDSDQVVGSAFIAGSGYQGFIYNNNGTFSLVDCPANTPTMPFGINDSGQVVGISGNALYGFLYTGGTCSYVPFYQIGYPEPAAINGDGLAAANLAPGGGVVLWNSITNESTGVGYYDGGIFVYGINDADQIVGVYTNGEGSSGFLGNPAGLSNYNLTVTISGSGAVTSTDGLINCPGTCSHSYPGGAEVTLNPTAGQGSVLSAGAVPAVVLVPA
jgi:hypothetical protein